MSQRADYQTVTLEAPSDVVRGSLMGTKEQFDHLCYDLIHSFIPNTLFSSISKELCTHRLNLLCM